MTTPRKVLIDPEVPLFYHLVSRCVRRSYLCGYDRVTRRNYKHRKRWLIDRLMLLGRYFALEVHAYTIMSNHFHLVVYYDPLACQRWSDEEVADRWLAVCPPRLPGGEVDVLELQVVKAALLQDESRLRHVCKELGSVSTFMKFLKQPIARRANVEDECTGHFFEQRFYSGALLDDESILAAMAYVDINPIQAEIEKTIEACQDSSVSVRLKEAANSAEALDALLAPLVSGLADGGRVVNVSLREYVRLLTVVSETPGKKFSHPDPNDRWRRHVASLKKRQRAYGSHAQLQRWTASRGLQQREQALDD
jgi:putative transposase